MRDHFQRTQRNFFAVGLVDRQSPRRLDAQWIQERMVSPHTTLVPVWRTRSAFVVGGEEKQPVLLPADKLIVPPDVDTIYLGEQEGVTYFAVDFVGDEASVSQNLPIPVEWHDLRDVGVWLAPREGALLAYSRAMTFWHHRHRFCGECGARTVSAEAGHVRACTRDICNARHFPRSDPAVIVLVTSPVGDVVERCLLGRPAAWAPRLYSTVAGFVEPGESVEHAVVREVAEETGITVAGATYQSSQPWPFPSSLMLGYRAQALNTEIALVDKELEDAKWFSREEMRDAVRAGSLRLPRNVSIAYRLVEDWFNEGHLGPLADIGKR